MRAVRAEEWLLIEWPRGETEPRKYWLSNLAENIRLRDLVALAKQRRWIIERDYQELKQELGLGHFEGRGWRGFTITPHSPSPPMASWWRSGAVFPPRPAPGILDYQSPNSHRTSGPGARVRPQRHNPHSIATLRIVLARSLLRKLCLCPFCGVPTLITQ